MNKHERQPHRLKVLQDQFWAGEIGDVEYFELASEAGAASEQIAIFLAEVREHDGILS